MKFARRAVLVPVLLLAGFAAGFPLGKNDGFAKGSEWALMQAGILAREAGLFMPVYLDEDTFKIVIRQPRNIYKRAWQLADRHAEKKQHGEREEQERPAAAEEAESSTVEWPYPACLETAGSSSVPLVLKTEAML